MRVGVCGRVGDDCGREAPTRFEDGLVDVELIDRRHDLGEVLPPYLLSET